MVSRFDQNDSSQESPSKTENYVSDEEMSQQDTVRMTYQQPYLKGFATPAQHPMEFSKRPSAQSNVSKQVNQFEISMSTSKQDFTKQLQTANSVEEKSHKVMMDQFYSFRGTDEGNVTQDSMDDIDKES